MKKGMIVMVVLLFCSVLFLKYIQRKAADKINVSSPVSSEQNNEGVSLPDDARTHDLTNNINVRIPKYITSRKITLLPERYGNISMCENGKVNEILEKYTKLWGYFSVTGRSIRSNKKNEKLYNMVEDLFACVGLVSEDDSYCDNLPRGAKSGEKKGEGDEDDSLFYECEERTVDIGFIGYMAGRVKDPISCEKDFLTGDKEEKELFYSIQPKDFCMVAGKGMESMCDSFSKNDSNLNIDACLCVFPRSSKDCNKCGNREKKEECLEYFQKYAAVKSGDYKKCAKKDENICKAFLTRSPKVCESIARELSKTYCGYYAELFKATGGVPGMSEADRKQYTADVEKKKMEEKRRKEEREIILRKINKRVKKIINSGK